MRIKFESGELDQNLAAEGTGKVSFSTLFRVSPPKNAFFTTLHLSAIFGR